MFDPPGREARHLLRETAAMIISASTDYREAARRKLPPFLFHYIDGGAYAEHTLKRNVADLAEVALRQRVLKNMAELDLSTELFGERLAMPLALAPVGLTGMCGGIAGMLIALDSGLDQTMVVIGLKAFPAALVGGLDSLVGALLGALIIAVAEVLLIHYVDPLLSDVVPFLVLIAMLVLRPWGLLGTREELDRV